jgi:multidrug efflux pump subunit AcrA (membrane-fusion protein)
MTRKIVVIVLLAALVAGGGWVAYRRYQSRTAGEDEAHKSAAALPPATVQLVKLSPEARKNLKLVSAPIIVDDVWRKILIPGQIIDRPGVSDRGVSAPAVGVVAEIHAYPGDTVKPGDRLFTLRVFSEYLQNTQSELYKAAKEIQLLEEQRTRLANLTDSGALPQARMIEVENQLRRQNTLIQAYKQDLLTRGLQSDQINEVAAGKFVSTIDVVAPPPSVDKARTADRAANVVQLVEHRVDGPTYEVQELKVELGQQVQAGELLAELANHHALYIEGYAFKREAPFLETAAQKGWTIDVEFAEDDARRWPALDQKFPIRHLANTVDPVDRTFSFFMELTNQAEDFEKDGRTYVVWRFRPGQRVRLRVPVELFEKVIELPAAAVVREGPEAYVFRQNGDLFTRIPVHVRYEDRTKVVIAPAKELTPGLYVAQNGAASLNRVLKAQAAAGVRNDVHVHADGSTHGPH